MMLRSINDADDSRADDEATDFDADTHFQHLEEIFGYFNQDVHDWAVCSIADKCAMNKRMARQLRVAHVSCMSNKQNLEVKNMVLDMPELDDTIPTVQETMLNCKRSVRNRAMLRNLMQLARIFHNKIRWSGTFQMLRRLIDIRSELLAVPDSSGATVTIDRREVFRNRAERYVKMLKEIDIVTKMLQKPKVSLSDCRLYIDTLWEIVQRNRSNQDTLWWGCKLRDRYIAIDSSLAPSSMFEHGVIKIQSGEASILIEFEKEACKTLRVLNTSDGAQAQIVSALDRISAKKRRCENISSRYINCNFVIESAASVERLWSIIVNILSDNRTPLLLESIVFLKINKSYWDLSLIREALNISRNDRVRSLMVEENEADFGE